MAKQFKYEKKCKICKKKFRHYQPQTKCCSEECRKLYRQYHDKRVGFFPHINGNTVGAITEIEIAADLMKKGYFVFRALSPACFCDLIAIKNNKFLKIECRTGYQSEITEHISFSKKSHGDVNCFAVYLANKNKIYYLEVDAKTLKNLDE